MALPPGAPGRAAPRVAAAAPPRSTAAAPPGRTGAVPPGSTGAARLGLMLLTGVTLAGCGTPSHAATTGRPVPLVRPTSASGPPAPPARVTVRPSSPKVTPTPTPTLSHPPATSAVPLPTPATTVSLRSSSYSLRTFTEPGGAQMTVAVFPAGTVRLVLHAGSTDPGGAASGLQARSVITAAERPTLVGAFNGGFLLPSGAGGYVQERRVIRSLVNGLATVTIDGSGVPRVGVWGRDLGGSPYSARQNLRPLVLGGRPAPDVGYPSHWGAVLGGSYVVARSALASDGAGDLIFAGSMATTPADLAAALIGAGASTGMELDINPQWVQLALAASPGGPLQTGLPGQHRPASQFLTGWSRDFFAVLAR